MNRLQIANEALFRIGANIIQSLDETSNDAIAINTIFDSTIEEVLRDGLFSAAMKRAKLALLPDAPLFEFSYAYAVPSDMIRLAECYDGKACKDFYWVIENNKILTNEKNVYVKYTYKPEDLNDLDSWTAQAISLRLAIKMAYFRTENKNLSKSLIDEYESLVIRKARSIDAITQNQDSGMGEVDWISSRGMGAL